MEPDTEALLETEYGMPPGRLMYHLYHERELSSHQIAAEISERLDRDVPYETVRYWLQQSGIKLHSRSLTDIQRILILAYLSAGLGSGTTATKVGCGKATVHRYKKDLEATGRIVDLDVDLEPVDYEILEGLIADDLGVDLTQDVEDALEAEYGMPPGRLMYHLHHERGLSPREIADEIGERTGQTVPRPTVRYWLQQSGIELSPSTESSSECATDS